MTEGINPVAQQRRLRAELRRLRDEAELTQQTVAADLEWSLSKVIRMETGVVGISLTDLRALLQEYGVTDKARIDELAAMARVARQDGWWGKYRPYFDRRFITFLGLEASATVIRQFQHLLIPGLLQTPDYARAVVSTFSDDLDRTNRLVQTRADRQRRLDEDPGPKLFFIVDESTILRQIGGPSVMREQLIRIRDLNDRPNISIQILPFTRGAHIGMRESFEVMEFAGDEDSYAVDLDRVGNSELIQNDPEKSSTWVENFYELEALAAPASELTLMVNKVLATSFNEGFEQ